MRVVALSLLAVFAIAGGATAFALLREPVPQAAPLTSASLPMAATVAPAEWLTDYPMAQKRAAEAHKPILADFTGSDWCGTCVALKKEVFDTPEFNTWASERVILLTVDFPNDTPQAETLKQQNLQLATTFGVDQFPTILFLDPIGKKLGQVGYVPNGPKAWIAAAEKSLK